MLPMGTIMAVSMLLAVVTATDLPVIKNIQKMPAILLRVIACLVLLSGLWNVLWYASQHLGEFWGNAAFISGVLMIAAACYNLIPAKLPLVFIKIKPVILFALLLCALLYSVTIYRM